MTSTSQSSNPEETRSSKDAGVKSAVDDDEMAVFGLVNLALRGRILVGGAAVTASLVVAAIGFTQARSYTSSASFIPQVRGATSSLSGLAAQFGVAVPSGDMGGSSAFYADLLKSREILGPVVDTRYSVRSDTGTVSGSLIDLYGIKGRSEDERSEAAMRLLGQAMTSSVVLRTGVVNLSVRARYPGLAHQIALQVLEELNRFNLGNRKSRAAAERQFTERRLAEVKVELREAEDRLQSFLQRNRDYRSSPVLGFAQDRLARDVALRQQVYATLAQAFEQAKIEEVRDTPVITTVEAPNYPVWPDSRHLRTKLLLALVTGAVVGLFLSAAREFVSKTEAGQSSTFRQFVALRAEALRDLRHPSRAIRRALGR